MGIDSSKIYEITADMSDIPSPDEYDIVGFGYPVHGFNAPEIMIDFARSLPAARGKRAFIFKTSGEPLRLNDCSSQKLITLLRKKGFCILSERHYVMPYNMIYRHSDELARQMWLYAKGLVKVHARELFLEKKEKTVLPFYKRLHAPLFRIEWVFAKIHGRAFRVDKSKCIDCGKCVKNCPTHNIKKDESGCYTFGGRCTLCVRCSFSCPKNAINIGILNGWKVNGAYDLSGKKDGETGEGKSGVAVQTEGKTARMYRRYFERKRAELAEGGADISELL